MAESLCSLFERRCPEISHLLPDVTAEAVECPACLVGGGGCVSLAESSLLSDENDDPPRQGEAAVICAGS